MINETWYKTADSLAMKLGIEKTAMIRARAGISFALTEGLDEGHCGLPRDDLLPLALKLLEIPDAIVLDALRRELDAGQVIADARGECLRPLIGNAALPSAYSIERPQRDETEDYVPLAARSSWLTSDMLVDVDCADVIGEKGGVIPIAGEEAIGTAST
jgi:hypothetical protein